MRMKEPYEAYLDDYNLLNVYMAKNFFDGNSRIFHMKDSKDQIIPLSILQRSDLYNGFTHYQLSLNSSIEIGEEYVLYDEHCKKTPCLYAHIVKTERFGKEYIYDGDDLGVTYALDRTTFKIWSPVAFKVVLNIKHHGKHRVYHMDKNEDGTFSLTLFGDYHKAQYTYAVRVNGKWNECVDPYNPYLGVNGSYSEVINPDLVHLPQKVDLQPLESNTDAIIYEASVRDMTSQTAIGVTHPKKFLGFVEENKTTQSRNTGLSYIKSLGVTHVQLLPVFKFGSVDEKFPNIFYNWGYDPIHHRALEGSYSSDPNDPICRVEEFAQMVHDLHANHLRVNLDLVFNHVYEKENYPLEILVPNYYFLMNQTGEFSNGSFCGNDIDTQPFMSKKYFIETCKYIINTFDVDGFRFDLMGILDVNFMNEVYQECQKLKPGFMIYGEGWNMPSFLNEQMRASQQNQYKMDCVGHFSDRFRDAIRGSNAELQYKGFSNGYTSNIELVKQVLAGSCQDDVFSSPEKVINFVECHDNHTLWDKNRVACHGEGRNIREKRSIMANALVLLAQGVPFIHCGQEFGRTKDNLGNTYNRSDTYNRVDYGRRDIHMTIVQEVQRLIQIRKNHPCFRLRTSQEIKENVCFDVIDHQALVYGCRKGDDECVVLLNPTPHSYYYHINESGKIIYDSERVNDLYNNHIQLAPYGVVVFQVNH